MNKCMGCDNITSNPKFCSRSCSVGFNNHLKSKRPPNPKKLSNCKVCGKSLYKTKCIMYCSKKCFFLEKEIKTKEEIFLGKSHDIRSIKKYLLKKHGIICKLCGLEKWGDSTIPLDIDHIDGNYQNNNLNNLRLICPNCHATTPNYKNKNYGHGRQSRRKNANVAQRLTAPVL